MGRVERSIEVNAPVERCYAMWTDFENFPQFMKNVNFIRHKGDEGVWLWEVKGPLGKNVSWEAEVDSMQPNKAVSWHSVRDAEVNNSGAVTFESLADNRTRVNVVISYDPPAGAIGEFVADIFSNPEKMVEEDLHNFQELVENSSYTVGVGSRTGYPGAEAGLGTTRDTTLSPDNDVYARQNLGNDMDINRGI